ncbi:hypothetical protein OG230_22825 [Streptomyces sp. NBC_00234]|uniref:hypothetical protein n=1 Tax=Streptomyces sp. NBC_00234 TaxID=2903638 RepID=UPI002E2826B5|nr:hypothetical protein [Streptomyces sp. NBC_00234]
MRDPLEFKDAVDRHVLAVEALRTGPYAPPWTGCADPGHSSSGDDFAVVVLRRSQGFWEAEDDGSIRDATREEFETELWGVVLALEKRWGPHVTVSAAPAYERRDQEGRHLPPLFEALRELGFDDLRVWEADGRSIAVGMGQAHREEPFVLLAAATGSPGGFDLTGGAAGTGA